MTVPGTATKTPIQKKKKMEKLESTQMWSPVKDIKNGVVLTKDGRYVQILEFSPINFNLLPTQERFQIADTFGKAVRIFPQKFQIKILSRRANVEPHINDIYRYMQLETNEECRKMQMETINLVKQNGYSGVTKRFFLSYAYEAPPGLRRQTWPEIVNSLQQRAVQIAGCFDGDPCNNELVSPLGDSDHTIGIMYECMNRAEAEIKSIDTKIEDVVSTYLWENKLRDDNLTIPINDFIAPQSIDPTYSPNYIVVDGKYHAYGVIPKQSYPLRSYPGWLSFLINLGEGIDVDIFVEKHSTEKIRQSLTKATNWTKADYNSKDDSSADIETLMNKLEAAKYFRAGLSNDQEFMYFSTMLSIIANSEEELKYKVNWVQSQLASEELKLRMLTFRHNEAFKMALPLCKPDERIFKQGSRNILSGDFGAAYPFTSYEINDSGGIMIGINQVNLSPIFINQFDQTLYSNGNMAIFGATGAGKTYTLQCLALRLRQQQVQTIIIAPYKGHDFRNSCKAVGGQFITIAPGSPHNINIMEIRKQNTENRSLLDGEDFKKISILMAKIQQIHIWFSMLLTDITPIETQILDESLIRTYERFGITARNKSLIDPQCPTRYKKMPLLGDLYRELEQRGDEAKRLLSVLKRFVSGSARSFNAPTNVNLDNPFIVIDVSECSDELLPMAIFTASDFVSDTVKADRTQKKAIIWDELHRLIGPAGSSLAAQYVLKCWKLFRGYRAICICATQDSNDFLSGRSADFGKGILAASKLKLLMKVERLEAAALAEILELSDLEETQLQNFKRGEALLIANRNHARIKVTASTNEHRIITTDPTELEEKLKEMKRKEV